MKTQYIFKHKGVKCSTWGEMLHLARLAEEQGYPSKESICFNQDSFNKGCVYFHVTDIPVKTIINMRETYGIDVAVLYDDFIANPDVVKEDLPVETIKVTGCKGCPFYAVIDNIGFCAKQSEFEPIMSSLLDTCPLKQKTLIIKLEHDQ